jgi:hypothetical protein
MLAWNDVIAKFSRIKLRGGIISTVFFALIVVTVCITIMMTSSIPIVSQVYGMTLVAFLFLVVFLTLIWFAVRNPHIAVFDGKELLSYERLSFEAKNKSDAVPLPRVENKPVASLLELDTAESEVVYG